MYIIQNFYEPKTNLYDILIHFFKNYIKNNFVEENVYVNRPIHITGL